MIIFDVICIIGDDPIHSVVDFMKISIIFFILTCHEITNYEY